MFNNFLMFSLDKNCINMKKSMFLQVQRPVFQIVNRECIKQRTKLGLNWSGLIFAQAPPIYNVPVKYLSINEKKKLQLQKN
jgi:hypothetical protein